MPTCWVPGCRTGYHGESDKSRHTFLVPKDDQRRALWNRKIPRDEVLARKSYVCDLHFEEKFILKNYEITVNGETTVIERGKWQLTADAIPSIFPNLPKYLSTITSKPRRVLSRTFNNSITANSCTSSSSVLDTNHEDNCLEEKKTKAVCPRCKASQAKSCSNNRKIRSQQAHILRFKAQLKIAKATCENLSATVKSYEELSPKLKTVISQAMQNSTAKSSKGNRYNKEWIIDSLLIKCKSPKTYKMLRENGYLPLPSFATLNRAIHCMRPDFGFDQSLCAGLKEKLLQFNAHERRGMLLFDEVQISKHLQFRPELGKVVGLVDYGKHTEPNQANKECDHALVFLFRPHLSGWIQTIGCFAASGTTPAVVLAKLVLETIILLENCGARVDGVVCDGASTNRKALSQMGFCGSKDALCNKMQNPCDDKRSIFFFSDVPHLLKTVRNNLLIASRFSTPSGSVKMEHYKLLYYADSNVTGLRAVPKLSKQHVEPNNFQKMSVSIAAQLFSRSVACGLKLYKNHVDGLSDCDPTIEFTKKMNHIFDLMNSRHPVDAIRLNDKRDQIKELAEAESWLDDWETFINNQPVSEQKRFLSRQTSQGLRVSLRSTRELSQILLQDGFRYVLTGKFNQDPLEMFFGMVRQSSGADDHPTANQFLFVYRLLSLSSLIKVPRRANVQTDPAQILVSAQSVRSETPSLLQGVQQRLKPLLDSACPSVVESASLSLNVFDDNDEDILSVINDMQLSMECTEIPNDFNPNVSYNCEWDLLTSSSAPESTPTQSILYYLAGYVAHKLKTFTNCEVCIGTLSTMEETDCLDAQLVHLRSFGGLKHPSCLLRSLLSLVEASVQKHISKLSANVYNDIVNDVFTLNDLANHAVGCKDHQLSLTSRCIHFYIATRIHFVNRECNRKRASRQEKQKLNKVAKLT